MVDCNDELTETLGRRFTNEEFNERYNDQIEQLTQDSINDMNIENASTDQWNEEYEIQRDQFLDDNNIVLSD